MRIAGFVPKHQNIEVEYVRSVHTVSRWIHEIFDRPEYDTATDSPPAAQVHTTTEGEAAAVAS